MRQPNVIESNTTREPFPLRDRVREIAKRNYNNQLRRYFRKAHKMVRKSLEQWECKYQPKQNDHKCVVIDSFKTIRRPY